MHNPNKKRKIDACQIESQEIESVIAVEQNLELEGTINNFIDRLSEVEHFIQKLKTKYEHMKAYSDSVKPTETIENDESVTVAFPLSILEEVSQFESEDLDSTVQTFIRNLMKEHKNFSIVFKLLVEDELVVMFSDWEQMSKYRFFSEILYGT